MSGCVAVLNAGSSSIKFAVYRVDGRADGLDLMIRGQVERIGRTPRLRVFDAAHKVVAEREWPGNDLDHRGATEEIIRTARQLIGEAQIRAVGHRVVHGGTHYAQPVMLDAKVVETLAQLIPLAPLHQPHNLQPIKVIDQAVPGLPQVACFDTAFHRSQPPLAQAFALPRKFSEEGVRRYGFHGLSYEFIVARLRELDPSLAAKRLVIAHLGNGASLAAVKDGRSVASTMGFTAVDGLMMGTRTGSLDPGVILYLMDSHGMDARAVEKMIYNEAGLLGVSGISSDMRTLRQSPAPEAREAIDLFVYRIVREIGSLAAALGGLDGVVFTGGIGENDIATRAEVAAQCRWLGLVLDEARNKAGEVRIDGGSSSIAAWVIPTDEERMIARHTMAVVSR